MILYLQQGERRFPVVLDGLKGHQASFIVAGQSRSAPIESLDGLWTGEFLVLWRPPPGVPKMLELGARGPAVAWLGDALAMAAGAEQQQHVNRFDAALQERLKAFQAQEGLDPDGIAGPFDLAEAQPSRRPAPDALGCRDRKALMSYILDALKKSEVQRHAGRIPTVAAPHGVLIESPRASRLGLLGWIVVALAVVVGAGWWASRYLDRPVQSVAVSPPASPAAPTPPQVGLRTLRHQCPSSRPRAAKPSRGSSWRSACRPASRLRSGLSG